MIPWDLEERAEDAIVAYLDTALDNVRTYAAWAFETIQYPAVIVHAARTEPIVDEAEWHNPRRVFVEVAVMTEAAPELDAGIVTNSTREQNRQLRSDVMSLLCLTDLHDQMNEQNIPGVNFSMVHVSGMERTTEGRHLISTVSLETIVNPIDLDTE